MPSTKRSKSKLEPIRHSLSHLMSMAVSEMYPKVGLGMGPAIENGFYQDYGLPETITPEILPKLEKRMREMIKNNIKFEQHQVNFKEALNFYKHDPYKKEIINDLKASGEKNVSFFKSGFFDNLCAGPHVKSTKEINPDAFKLTKIAGAYWKGSEKNPMLTRIYGVAFNDKKGLDEYLKAMEVAELCDHRALGEKLELFMSDEEVGRGLPLWLPKGYVIRKKLEDYLYNLEKQNGYEHVLTPHIAKETLYKKSGHLAHYKEEMYAPITIDEEKYYLKPMNCPHHHSIYKHHKRSYRELPMRIAEFGTVYRYERSGVLSGLIRVRGFTQNDAHIYTDQKNLEKEIIAVLKMHKKVYDDFGIKDYWYRLSLPDFKNKEKFGDVKNKKMWENGASILKKSLENTKHKFVEGVGEATFYGPKIDIQIKDLYGREDTIATIQVDYYSASRFNLSYINEKGKEEPVIIIHRAIFGSFDRFFAFLLEKTCGNLPVWLAPVAVKILAVSVKQKKYAEKILEALKENGIEAELAPTDETLGKRIRQAEMQKIPYILIVGEKEESNKTVSVRHRKRGQENEIEIKKLVEKIKGEIQKKSL